MDRRDQLAGGVAGALLLGGIMIGLLQTVTPDTITAIETPVPASVLVFVVVGLLGLFATVSLRESGPQKSSVEPLVTGLPPERPQRPPAIVGDEFTAAVNDAAQAVRVRQTTPEETGPYQRLHTTAISVISRAQGCSVAEAETLVTGGDWTDDPVARAFLSQTATHPRWFRLLRWARPELAYERGVSRTITAIQSIAVADVPGYTSQTGRTAPEAVETSTAGDGVLGTLRAVFGASSSVAYRGDAYPHPETATRRAQTDSVDPSRETDDEAGTVATDRPDSTAPNAANTSPTGTEEAAVTDGEGTAARTEVASHE